MQKERGDKTPQYIGMEDAEEEQVEIIENHAPKRMVVENGKLVGMKFEKVAPGGELKNASVSDESNAGGSA